MELNWQTVELGGTDMMWWTGRILVITWATKFGSSGSLWRNDWVRLKRRLLQWSRGDGTRLWPWMAAAWERERGGLKRLMLHRWRYAERGMLLMCDWNERRRVWTEKKWEHFSLFNLRQSLENKVFLLRGSQRGKQTGTWNRVCWWDPLRIGNGCCIYAKHYQEELTLVEWLKSSTAQKVCIFNKWNINEE